MFILPEYNFTYLLDDVDGLVVPRYCWFYSVEQNDFMLQPIRLLEETTGWTVQVAINGVTFMVPALWNLLIVDVETRLVDTVQIAKCSSNSYQAFLMSPNENTYRLAPIVLQDLHKEEACVHVMIPKLHMLVHPVGSLVNTKREERIFSCLLSPQDLGKHMHDMTALELLI